MRRFAQEGFNTHPLAVGMFILAGGAGVDDKKVTLLKFAKEKTITRGVTSQARVPTVQKSEAFSQEASRRILMALKTRLTHGGKSLNISIDGRFDYLMHDDFRSAYERADGELSCYIVDMGSTKYIDSSALGMLLTLRKYADGHGANVQIANASEEIRRLLNIANFQKLFALR